MTIEAQRPTGRPDTAPRGPAGPRPEPHGPKTPTRPADPPPRPPGSGALIAIDDALAAVAAVAKRLPEPSDQMEAAGLAILDFRLRRARAAVADLLTYSGRDGKAASAESRPVQATRLLPGERPAPGSGAASSGAVTESDGAVVAPIAGALLPAGQPPLPGGDFLLPRDVRLPLFESLTRRAD